MFEPRNQNLRVLDLINEHDYCSCEVQEVQMNTTSHQSILQALEQCANRYQSKGKMSSVDDQLVSWALDKTGMVNTSNLWNGTETNEQTLLVELPERSWVENLGMSEEVLQVHMVRYIWGNCNKQRQGSYLPKL